MNEEDTVTHKWLRWSALGWLDFFHSWLSINCSPRLNIKHHAHFIISYIPWKSCNTMHMQHNPVHMLLSAFCYCIHLSLILCKHDGQLTIFVESTFDLEILYYNICSNSLTRLLISQCSLLSFCGMWLLSKHLSCLEIQFRTSSLDKLCTLA